ncbi:hypothetical protein N5J76_02875 [Pseudomonas sp. GD03855]|nr:hypothetical protein [Pseudomonas sp. GD03856]MDH2263862.1 hypothetical protein [Pseudomonas sp. GD03855]
MNDYGFEATNNSGTVTISGATRLLVFSERGTVRTTSSNSDRPGYGAVTLAKPIKTTATPEIFVRVATHNRTAVSIYFTFIGQPGNWTGFKITVAAGATNNLIDHTFEYVACKYSDSPGSEDYGLELYNADGSGEVIFNSTDSPVIFSRFSKRWQWQSISTSSVDIYASGITIDADDFIGVSGFDRGLVFFGNAEYAGLRLISSNARVLQITVNKRVNEQHQDPLIGRAFNFCAPICKFPASIYHN